MSKKAFEKFYLTNVDKIYRFVFFRVNKDKELAQDLVSEIFMKALENFTSYDPKISASAWVFTIAKNHLANYWRDLKPSESLTFKTEEIETENSSLLTASVEHFKQEGLQIEIKNEVEKLLEQLNPEECELVTFHYLLGYSYTEIAKIKGTSEGVVKVATHRALKKLRQNI